MNIAIVDDEIFIREQIRSLIKRRKPDCRTEIFTTGEELLEAGQYFNLIFLDIQMEGINGIETARILRKQHEDAVLVFITGIREYVFEAFDVSAFHYLLKPIEEQKFMDVFDRAVKEAVKQRGQKQEQLFIRTKNRNFTIKQNSILYIENRAKKVEIHTIDAEEIIEIYATMEEMHQKLGESFYRCHRGYLVNMAHITGYSGDSISLSNGEKVYLSKKKHSEFVKEYMWYLQNGGISCV